MNPAGLDRLGLGRVIALERFEPPLIAFEGDRQGPAHCPACGGNS